MRGQSPRSNAVTPTQHQLPVSSPEPSAPVRPRRPAFRRTAGPAIRPGSRQQPRAASRRRSAFRAGRNQSPAFAPEAERQAQRTGTETPSITYQCGTMASRFAPRGATNTALRPNVCFSRRRSRPAESRSSVACALDLSCLHELETVMAAYSIRRSARRSTDCGITLPSALAAFMLTTSSKFVGRSTGMAAGFAPLRTRSTYEARRT